MSSKGISLFRVDGSVEVGSGHVVRCLTLANALSAEGWECMFSCPAETLKAVPALESSPYKIIPYHSLGRKYDLLIVDHYGLDIEFESSCRSWAKKILVIDDLADRSHDCDILLDQTFGRNTSDYKALVPKHCRLLMGSNYALLRPQFSENREKALLRRKEKDEKIENLLVFMGGTDPYNITEKVLDALLNIETSLNIDVIMGANAPYLKQVKCHINNIKQSNILLHINVENMALLMLKADLSIGAGGTTSWERCCLGLPTLVIQVADNQKVITHLLEEKRAIIDLGLHSELSADKVNNVLLSFMRNPGQLIEISQNAANICDGLGTQRVIQEITRVCS